jgi:LysR family transcriptional regulator, glycine cleavage system transcriptional activator
MHRDLPPLELLRGFEASARNLSFTKAGAELFLTQSAISRQVKALEDQLGVQLFRRRHRELLLTEPGQTLYKAVGEALRTLRDATVKLSGRAGGMLTVTTTISFASLWLVPRLTELRRLHPEIDVRIAATNEMADMERDGIDLAIRYCAPEAAGPAAVALFGEKAFPVCAPALASSGQLTSPKDLGRHVLLHYDDPERRSPWLSWEVWFELVKSEGVKPAGTLRFSHYDQMIQAALDGQGIALGRSPLVDRWVREGRLVLPFGRRFISSPGQARAYFILVSAAARGRPEFARFSAWVQHEAASGSGSPARPARRRTGVKSARS